MLLKLADIGNYGIINKIYGEWLEDVLAPSRAAYEVPNLPANQTIHPYLYKFPVYRS